MSFFRRDDSLSTIFDGTFDHDTQEFLFMENGVISAEESGFSGSPLNLNRSRDMSRHSNDEFLAGSTENKENNSETNLESNGRQRRIYEKQLSANGASPSGKKAKMSNAAYAKQNREKKKLQYEKLEAKVEQLTARNGELETRNGELDLRVQTLEQEAITVRNLQLEKTEQMKDLILQKEKENQELLSCVHQREQEIFYLKSVIANDSAIGRVLSSLQSSSQVYLTTSFDQSKYSGTNKGGERVLPSSGGVCLHVDGSKVSLEMCFKCAQMAVGAPQPVGTSGMI